MPALEIVARLEGDPPRLALCLPPPAALDLERLRSTLGDPSLSPGKRALVIQQYRVAEAIAHKQADERELLAAFLEHVAGLQREYLLSRQPAAWHDAPLGTLAGNLGCPLVALPRILKGRAVAVGEALVPLDDLVGVERFAAGELADVKPDVLVPTDAVRSRAVVDALLEVFQEGRQAILDPVLVVPHPTEKQLGYVCEGNHRTAAAHLAGAKVRRRLLRTKDAVQFHLSGTLAARLAASNTHEAFVAACAEQAAHFGYRAGSWDLYLSQTREPDAGPAVRVLTSSAGAKEDDTTSDALRVSVMELFEGLPGRTFSAAEIEERLVLMGVPKNAVPKRERLEVYLRHGLRRIKETSPGRFALEG